MNHCTFIGTFTHDPQLNVQSKGEGHAVSFTNFRLAIQHKFKKTNKEVASHTALLDFEAWHSGAEVLCSRFRKGDTIAVQAMAKTYKNTSNPDKNDTVFRVEHFETIPITRTNDV
jgi:single-stranded DNA-binding protein